MNTLHELFEEQIKDLYNAEQQLIKALPKMRKGASTPELQDAIDTHLEETREHARRLEELAAQVGFKPSGKACKAMKGLIEEGAEVLEEDGEDSVLDGGIIAAAQKVEHYEISAYGTARALARLLGLDDAADILEQTLEEESAADEKLTEIAENAVYPNAPHSEGDEEDETEAVGARNGARSAGGRAGNGRRNAGNRRGKKAGGGSSRDGGRSSRSRGR